jgi:hypothetical protein
MGKRRPKLNRVNVAAEFAGNVGRALPGNGQGGIGLPSLFVAGPLTLSGLFLGLLFDHQADGIGTKLKSIRPREGARFDKTLIEHAAL